jgi:hypothetical protein
MKKLLLFLTLFLSLNNSAQSWCTPGSVWHFGDYFVAGSGYKRMEYLYDTLIAGNTCNKIKVLRIGFGSMGFYSNTSFMYTYANNNVVYLKDANSSNFDTLYYFNATIGNKWRTAPTSMAACAASYVTVLDTGHTIIQGQNLKWYTISYTLSPSVVSYAPNDTVFERLGAVLSYPYYWGNICATYYDADIGGPLRCFTDNQINDYRRNYSGPCDYLYVSLNEQPLSGNFNRLYPNPVIDKLHFSHAEKFDRITVSNAFGQTVKEVYNVINEYEIDVSDLSAGMYYVKTENNAGQNNYKVFKK